MRTYFIFSFLLFSFLQMNAQYTLDSKDENQGKKGVIFYNETAFNANIHTNGIALGVSWGKLKTYYLTKYFKLELGKLKHQREKRQNSNRGNQPNGKVARPFVFGKKNSFYTVRALVGRKKYFSEKQIKKGVAVGVSYEGGFSLGLLKPYYLEVFFTQNDNQKLPVSIKYSEENRDRFLDQLLIFGASKWTKGFSEISLIPGVNAKVAAHFDWGAYDEYVKALEVGLMIDAFYKKVPIMVETENLSNQFIFLNVFVNLQLGARR